MREQGLSCRGWKSAWAVVGALAAACAFGETRTISGETVTVGAEAELGAADTILLTKEGGVAFTQSQTLAKSYTFDGTGVVSVADGKTVLVDQSRFAKNTLGHTFVKDGAGTLLFTNIIGVCSAPTRWIVREGVLAHSGNGLYGGHNTTTENPVLDVREGATFRLPANAHNPVGRVELTGGTLESPARGADSLTSVWGDTSFQGDVFVHAADTPSVIMGGKWIHLRHARPDSTFTVDRGATLHVYAALTNGWDDAATAQVANVLTVRGGGDLYLLGVNGWTGGTVIEDGTKVHVGSATALGTGPLTVRGDAEIEVLSGCTFACPPLVIEGTAKLTFTGAGAVALPADLPAGLEIDNRATGEHPAQVEDGVLYVGGGLVTLNVGSDLTLTDIRGIVSGSGARTDLLKTGAGTLTLPNKDNAAKFRKMDVLEGYVAVSAANNFGGDETFLTGDGGILALDTFTLKTPIRINGTGHVRVAEGKTWTVTSNCLFCAGNTVVKDGKGVFKTTGNFITPLTSQWTVDEGVWWNTGNFGSHRDTPSRTIEVHEAAQFRQSGHLPLGNVVLRGGTLMSSDWFSQTGTSGTEINIDRTARWPAFSFNSSVNVHPSKDGSPSLIQVDNAVCLGHASHWTVFNIDEGATLEIDAVLQPGENSAATEVQPSTLVKKGKGNLFLKRACGAQSVVEVREGTLTLAKDARLSPKARLAVMDDAKVALEDGALLATSADPTAGLLGSADIWVDVTRLGAMHGSAVNPVPNLGVAGGAFAVPTAGTRPGMPTFVTNAVNGLPVLRFNGNAALTLNAYTNRTANVAVFMVARWTSWDYNGGKGGKGRWGGSFSMCTTTATGNDNLTSDSLHTESVDSINDTLVYAPSRADSKFSITNPDRGVGTPYLDAVWMEGNTLSALQSVGDGAADVTGTTHNDNRNNFNIDVVALGGRLTKNGGVQYTSDGHANNRMFIGDVGEFIAFTRTLTEAERNAVVAYLKRKWLGSAVTAAAPVAGGAGTPLVVSVPEGARATLAGTVNAEFAAGATVLAKEGGGTLDFAAQANANGLADVKEGTLNLPANGRIASCADVWIDAADATGVETDASGKVKSLRNKGRAGGTFKQAKGFNGAAVPLPAYRQDGMNGLPAFAFDGNSGLCLDAYVNRGASRSQHIYLVMRQTSYEDAKGKGLYAGPISFTDSTVMEDDYNTPGSFHYEVVGKQKIKHYLGTSYLEADLGFNPTGTDCLFVSRQYGKGAMFAFERAGDAESKVKAWGQTATTDVAIDRVGIGGRCKGDRLLWGAKDNESNRMWFGLIGEMIVFRNPLGYDEERELLGYLRKKWFNKGEGSATPPAFLSGDFGAPSFGESGLVLRKGTAVASDGPTVALASLLAEDDVAWARKAGPEPAGFAIFDVAGALTVGMGQSLYVPTAPKGSALLIGGDVTGELAPWTVTGEKANRLSVERGEGGVWLNRLSGLSILLR